MIKVQCPRIIVNCLVFRETFHISVPNKFSTESKDICVWLMLWTILEKPVYSPLNGATFVRKCICRLSSVWVAPMKKWPNLLYQLFCYWISKCNWKKKKIKERKKKKNQPTTNVLTFCAIFFYIGINIQVQRNSCIAYSQHVLEKIGFLLHVITFPKWKSVKFLNIHSKDLEEWFCGQVTLQKESRMN